VSKLRSAAMTLCLVAIFLPSLARAQATANNMKLLTENTGWALMNGHLYWTTDFGQDWRDITPPAAASPRGSEQIADVFFLDISNGWALLRVPASGGEYGDWRFDIASTSNAGIAWSVVPVAIPNWNPRAYSLGGSGTIDFVDTMHGWLDLSIQSSPATNWGALFVTSDGGQTWEWAPTTRTAPGVFGSLRFVSPAFGWLAGGPGDTELYVTRDGCRSWQKVSPPAPPQAGPDPLARFNAPAFQDSLRGLLPVSYAPSRGWAPPKLVVFTTADGGRTWSPTIVLTGDQADNWVPVTTVGSAVVVPVAPTYGRVRVLPVAGDSSVPPTVETSKAGVVGLSFVDSERGWVLHFGGPLCATGDGGATCKDITPKAPATEPHPIITPQGLRNGPAAPKNEPKPLPLR
jgi:photosystem II stability/assembly factor-like uncharacterized protein